MTFQEIQMRQSENLSILQIKAEYGQKNNISDFSYQILYRKLQMIDFI